MILNIKNDPKTFRQAMSYKDVAFQKEAVNDEMAWVLVDLPPGSKPIECKWMFRKKIQYQWFYTNLQGKISCQRFYFKRGC